MSEQEVVLSWGWWLTRNGCVYQVVRAEPPEIYRGVSQPWTNVPAFDCRWSDDGRYMPPFDSIFDLLEKLAPSDPRVISYEPEYGRPATMPVQAEPVITRAIRPDCTWTPGRPDGGGLRYYTNCGNRFDFTEGTPTENGIAFCSRCGGMVIEGRPSNE